MFSCCLSKSHFFLVTFLDRFDVTPHRTASPSDVQGSGTGIMLTGGHISTFNIQTLSYILTLFKMRENMRKAVVEPRIKQVVTLCWNGRFSVELQGIASLQHSMLRSDCHTTPPKHTAVKTCCNW